MDNFIKAPPEKRTAVINAGFVCFGRDGYEKTAMSEAAEEAGVSKAALFHYFGSKKGYYRYIFKFACEEILKRFQEAGQGSRDFFENVYVGARIKYEVTRIYPGMYDFLLGLARDASAELIAELTDIWKDDIREAVARLNSRVDWGRFKSEEDRELAANLVGWASWGITRSPDSRGKNWHELVAEHKRYLDLIKRAVYKEEYL